MCFLWNAQIYSIVKIENSCAARLNRLDNLVSHSQTKYSIVFLREGGRRLHMDNLNVVRYSWSSSSEGSSSTKVVLAEGVLLSIIPQWFQGVGSPLSLVLTHPTTARIVVRSVMMGAVLVWALELHLYCRSCIVWCMLAYIVHHEFKLCHHLSVDHYCCKENIYLPWQMTSFVPPSFCYMPLWF
jgi:hypothetical protein